MKMQSVFMAGLVVFVIAGGAALYFVHSDSSLVKTDIASTTAETSVRNTPDAADKPSCTISTDKRFYAPGSPMRFTWTSKNATNVTFIHRENVSGTPEVANTLTHVPDGSGSPNIDSTPQSANGSLTIPASLASNYEVAILEAYGPKGNGYCTAQYYVGNDDLPSGSTPITFDSLPVTLTFDLHHTKAISKDNSLSITRATYGVLSSANGTPISGNAVFLIRDGETVFPAYVSFETPQVIALARGNVLLSLSSFDGKTRLEVTPQ